MNAAVLLGPQVQGAVDVCLHWRCGSRWPPEVCQKRSGVCKAALEDVSVVNSSFRCHKGIPLTLPDAKLSVVPVQVLAQTSVAPPEDLTRSSLLRFATVAVE